MKKDMPKTKDEFVDMLMREHGHDFKLAYDCASVVEGYGAFNPILHDAEAVAAVLLLIRKGYTTEDIGKAWENLNE